MISPDIIFTCPTNVINQYQTIKLISYTFCEKYHSIYHTTDIVLYRDYFVWGQEIMLEFFLKISILKYNKKQIFFNEMFMYLPTVISLEIVPTRFIFVRNFVLDI